MQFAPVAIHFPTSDNGFSGAALWGDLQEQEDPIFRLFSDNPHPHHLRERVGLMAFALPYNPLKV